MASVVIIGSGLAGLSAARSLAERGVASVLVSPQRSERAASVLAEGGINAALDLMGEGDSWRQHYADTMAAGLGLADAEAVAGLCSSAPGIVRDLAGLGVPFQSEDGRMVQRYFGGQTKARTAFVGSTTGKMLVTALSDALRRYEAEGLVERRPSCELLQLGIFEGSCQGAWVRDLYTGRTSFLCGPVILASGSFAGLFGPRITGSQSNTGDVAAIAFSQGVEMANLEFLQYHPTTIPILGKRLLVTEAARGEGGRLFTLRGGERYYFMEELYPELGNLMPRDVVSREEHAQYKDPANDGRIYLDLTGLSDKTWEERLSELRDEILRYTGKDPASKPIVVRPGIHYCMGGVLVDACHASNIEGLFAAGECACAYHGANRLGGNSVLGAIYGGSVAARSADELIMSGFACEAGPPLDEAYASGSDDAEPALECELEDASFHAMGIVRDAPSLAKGIEALEGVEARAKGERTCRRARLARAVLISAERREESRGAHTRSDFPESSEEFRKNSVVLWDGTSIAYGLRPIPSLSDTFDLDAWEARR